MTGLQRAGRWVAAVLVAAGFGWGAAGAVRGAEEPRAAAPAEAPEPPPGLSQIVPLAVGLEQDLAALEAELAHGLDREAVGRQLDALAAQVKGYDKALGELGRGGRYSYEDAAGWKATLDGASAALERALAPVQETLDRLDVLRGEWTRRRDRWARWKKALAAERKREEIAAAFRTALDTANRALARIDATAAPLLELQHRAAEIQAAIQRLRSEADDLLREARQGLFRRSGPPMFTAAYWSELGRAVAGEGAPTRAVDLLPGRAFWARSGWVVLLQAVLVGVLWGALRRRAEALGASERWRFIARRPAATAVLMGAGLPSALYPEVPPPWRFVLWAVVGIAAARLVALLIRGEWRRRLVYLLVVLFLASQAFRLVGLPAPLVRLYVLVVGALGVPLCLWRARVAVRSGLGRYAWALRAGALVLAATAVAEVLGYDNLAVHLLESSIQTTFVGLLAWMGGLLLHGGVEYFLGPGASAWRRLPLAEPHRKALSRDLGLALTAGVWLVAAGVILEVWRVYEGPWRAVRALLDLGVPLGQTRITVGVALGAAVVLYGAVLTSWVVQGVLEAQVYPRRDMPYGTRVSINRLIHYAFALTGFLAAVSALGFELRNLTILAGAFGIGIGFGLQTIVNNFVSGLILLFERPIKVGDVIQIGDQWATVRKLGLRATVVETLNRAEVIVPNSDLVSGQVTNWTLTDRMVRLVVPVGVAYGSDVPKVMEILQRVAEENERVAEWPEPQVLFLAFGESSLDFELRAWIRDVDDRLAVLSDLHLAIDREFRKAGVEIPFPQRDLHLRSVDPGAAGALARRESPTT